MEEDIPGHPQEQKSVWTERRGRSKEREDRRLRKEKIPDRQTVLLQYLREILGISMQPKCPLMYMKRCTASAILIISKNLLNCVFFLFCLSESKDRPDSAAVQKTKGFYRSCLDTRSIDTAGAEPFLSLIHKVRSLDALLL